MNRVILAVLVVILGLNIFMVVEQQKKSAESSLMPEVEVVEVTDSSHCVDLNEEETLRCLENVIAQGNYTGNDLFILGQLYFHGIGQSADKAKGIQEIEKSAINFNELGAIDFLGDYAAEEGDRISAQYWYARAIANGYLPAQLKLANIYRYQPQSEREFEVALNLYQDAANRGSLDALYELALLYATGTGVEADLEGSQLALKKGCDEGHQKSCDLLGQIENLLNEEKTEEE